MTETFYGAFFFLSLFNICFSNVTFHKETQEPHTVRDCQFLVGEGGRGQVLIYFKND